MLKLGSAVLVDSEVFVMQVARRESKREDNGTGTQQRNLRVMAVIVGVYVVIDIVVGSVVNMRLCSCAHEAVRQRQAKTGAIRKRNKDKEDSQRP